MRMQLLFAISPAPRPVRTCCRPVDLHDSRTQALLVLCRRNLSARLDAAQQHLLSERLEPTRHVARSARRLRGARRSSRRHRQVRSLSESP